MELDEEESNIEAMVTAARDGALPALAIALIPALIAARGVLRPVRELRRAAASMGRGRLDTRIHAKGSDELADLARTFNESAAELERSVTELRRAEARAASRRGSRSTTRSFRPSHGAPSRASGTSVVLPAPGGATSTALPLLSSALRRPGRTSETGSSGSFAESGMSPD